jgi:drug/metabolite transporter (DMT)-like permease
LRRDAAVALGQTSVTAALWGTSFPVISVALREGLNPSVFVFLRFATAAPLMLVFAFSTRRGVMALMKSKAIWIVALFDAVGFLCQYVGQQYTPASVAALLINLSVVLAAVGAAVFLGEKLGAYKVTGVALAFAGTVLIATNGNLGSVAGGELLGDALYLLAAFSWAAYIVYAKRKTDETNWDPYAAATCIVSLTALFVLPAALAAGGPLPTSPAAWEAIAYTAVFNTAIPFALYQAALKHLTAASSAIVLMLEIVVAVIISVAFLGETFTAFSLFGALGVLASILLVSGVEVRGGSAIAANARAG